MERLEQLKGRFWTNQNELIEEIEELGFEVVAESGDEIAVMEKGDDETEYCIWIIVAGKTIAIENITESELL